MVKTKYAGVYMDQAGQYFYETELGTDRITGKRLRKKSRMNQQGKKFTSATQAYKELVRVKNEFLKANGYGNYHMTYGQFMDTVYIPAYETEVEESTFYVRERTLEAMRDRFSNIELRALSVEDVQRYRTWLLSDKGAGFSQAYASLVFGMFRKSLDMAVDMQYLESNIAKRVKAIPKGKSNIPYWNKKEFEAVISKMCLDDFYEHLCFVMIWTYFMTGIRVSEGTALWWEDVDFKNKRLRIHHSMYLKSKSEWTRKNYTKTADGQRIISLDEDTVRILKEWKVRQAKIGIHDFVFSYDGMPMIKSTIARMIARFAKLANVRRIQAKGLRHSHASYLINEFNVSVLILSKRLGHSSPEITLKHYSHMWAGVDELIAEEMTGNVKIQTAPQSSVSFSGNQAISHQQTISG